MKVTEILNEDTKQILSEESLQAIEEALQNKINLAVETALTEQDDLYSEKLTQLLAAIDKDHTTKLKRVVEAIDRDNSKKLLQIVEKYELTLTEEANKFKATLVESISDYLEEFLSESIPTEAIVEATKNKTAMTVLENLRKVLAIDSALMKESVQDAVVDGKNQIDKLAKQVNELSKENAILKENFLKTKSELVLEGKIASLPDKKKEYLRRVLGDKSPKFIEENFDYTLRLFEKKEKERLEVLKEEAFKDRSVKADVQPIKEATKPQLPHLNNPYLAELQKIK